RKRNGQRARVESAPTWHNPDLRRPVEDRYAVRVWPTHAVGHKPWSYSPGPRLLASALCRASSTRNADREADLLGHPYIGVEHLDLGRLHLAGQTMDRGALRQRMRVNSPLRWWRPLGPRCALGRQGREQTQAARLSADRDEHGDDAASAR